MFQKVETCRIEIKEAEAMLETISSIENETLKKMHRTEIELKILFLKALIKNKFFSKDKENLSWFRNIFTRIDVEFGKCKEKHDRGLEMHLIKMILEKEGFSLR